MQTCVGQGWVATSQGEANTGSNSSFPAHELGKEMDLLVEGGNKAKGSI